MFETFDHTADLGLRIRAADRATLFVEAARALFSTIVEDPAAIVPVQSVRVDLPADEDVYLLFDWLNRLLYHFDSDHLVFGEFAADFDATGFHGEAWGEPLDEPRHVLLHEVKAITYHELKVEESADGWMAELIVDI